MENNSKVIKTNTNKQNEKMVAMFQQDWQSLMPVNQNNKNFLLKVQKV